MGSSLRRMLDDDFTSTNSTVSARAGNILETWDLRGAKRPITDFYSLEGPLGEGNYGKVERWKCRSSSELGLDDPYVAVKLINWTSIWRGWVRDRKQEELLRNELKMLLMLDNPFIIKFKEWFEQACTGISFVTELCSGPSLQDVLEGVCMLPASTRQARMPRLRRYFREITYAVSYIHGFTPPVVHRDLKPDNVLLKWPGDPNSVVKLIDFGLASLQESGREGHEQLGTPVFMAPEQYLGSGCSITREMDIWALGVIFAWIITALEHGSLQHPMLPADEGKEFDVRWIALYRAYRERQPWNRELFGAQPESAFVLCDRILEHDPARRISATDMLEEAWVRCGDPAAAAAAELLRQGHVITNIRTYSALSGFDKKILSLMADNVHDKQVILLRRTFQALDTSKTGKLSWTDLVDGFRSNDVDFPEGVLNGLFEEMDKEGTGLIAYHDWLAATMGSRILLSGRALASAFRALNPSGTGSISRAELERAVGVEEADAVLSDPSVLDDDGCVPFKGFRRLAKKVAERRMALSQPEAIALSADIHRGGPSLRSSCPPIVGALGEEAVSSTRSERLIDEEIVPKHTIRRRSQTCQPGILDGPHNPDFAAQSWPVFTQQMS